MASREKSTDIMLAQQIAELRGITVKGFEGVNAHLATLNGRVGKHDDLFDKVLKEESFDAGMKKGKDKTWKVLLSIVTVLVGYLAIVGQTQCWTIICNAK